MLPKLRLVHDQASLLLDIWVRLYLENKYLNWFLNTFLCVYLQTETWSVEPCTDTKNVDLHLQEYIYIRTMICTPSFMDMCICSGSCSPKLPIRYLVANLSIPLTDQLFGLCGSWTADLTTSPQGPEQLTGASLGRSWPVDQLFGGGQSWQLPQNLQRSWNLWALRPSIWFSIFKNGLRICGYYPQICRTLLIS